MLITFQNGVMKTCSSTKLNKSLRLDLFHHAVCDILEWLPCIIFFFDLIEFIA